MNDVEMRIGETFAERAEAVGPAGFTADEVLRAGRRARARRQHGTLAAATAAVGLVTTVTLSLGTPGAAPPGPTATAPHAWTPPGIPAGGVHLDYAQGTTIRPWEPSASPIVVPLPEGYTVTGGARATGGWVVEAQRDDAGARLWWQPRDGALRDLGPVSGSWQVSAAGSVLVVAGEPAGTVTAYELPGAALLAQTTFEGGMGPVVVAATQSRALLREASGDGSATIAGVWDFLNHTVRRTTEPVHVWGMGSDGDVLLRSGDGCVTVVPASQLSDSQPGGVCNEVTAQEWLRGRIDPAGGTAVLQASEATYRVFAADLTFGVWQPYESGPPMRLAGFDASGNLFARRDTITGSRALLHCTSVTECRQVALPSDAVPLLGAG